MDVNKEAKKTADELQAALDNIEKAEKESAEVDDVVDFDSIQKGVNALQAKLGLDPTDIFKAKKHAEPDKDDKGGESDDDEDDEEDDEDTDKADLSDNLYKGFVGEDQPIYDLAPVLGRLAESIADQMATGNAISKAALDSSVLTNKAMLVFGRKLQEQDEKIDAILKALPSAKTQAGVRFGGIALAKGDEPKKEAIHKADDGRLGGSEQLQMLVEKAINAGELKSFHLRGTHLPDGHRRLPKPWREQHNVLIDEDE